MYTISLLFACLHLVRPYAGQDTIKYKIDIRRVKLHEDIDKSQLQLLKSDGRDDQLISVLPDEDVNLLVTDVFIRQVNLVQDSLERSTVLDHRLKVKYLTGLENLLKGYLDGWRKRTLAPEKGVVLFAGLHGNDAGRSGRRIYRPHRRKISI